MMMLVLVVMMMVIVATLCQEATEIAAFLLAAVTCFAREDV